MKIDQNKIRTNIFKLINCSGINKIDFANMLGMSDRQLRRIELGKAEFSMNTIAKCCEFFSVSFELLNKDKIEVDTGFRNFLLMKHSGNTEFEKLLTDRPSITYAIDFVLMKEEAFNKEGMTVDEIRKVFSAHNWVYTSAYISLALSRRNEEIGSTQLPGSVRKKYFKIKG